MAIVVDLPEDLAQWQALQDVLFFTDDQPLFCARLAIFDARVVAGRAPIAYLPKLTIIQYNGVIDTLRPVKAFGIRPPLPTPKETTDVVLPLIEEHSPMQKPYVWRWIPCFVSEELLAPNATDQTVTIAVAELGGVAKIGPYKHLISLSQLFTLSPLKQGVHVRLREDARMWGVCVRMDVSLDHFFRSNNSIAKLMEVREGVFGLERGYLPFEVRWVYGHAIVPIDNAPQCDLR